MAKNEREMGNKEEESDRSIAFLDVYVTREEDGQLSSRVYRKPSNTNVSIKPHSCQHPDTYKGIFKAELCRAYRLCSSATKTQEEIRYVTDLFEDNGFNRKELEKIIDEYKPSEKPKGCNKQYQPKNNTDKNDNPENLFDVLPFRDTDAPGTEEDRKPYVVMPFLPDGVYHQMRRACKKVRSLGQVLSLKIYSVRRIRPTIIRKISQVSTNSHARAPRMRFTLVRPSDPSQPVSMNTVRLRKRVNGPTQEFLNIKKLVKKK